MYASSAAASVVLASLADSVSRRIEVSDGAFPAIRREVQQHRHCAPSQRAESLICDRIGSGDYLLEIEWKTFCLLHTFHCNRELSGATRSHNTFCKHFYTFYGPWQFIW